MVNQIQSMWPIVNKPWGTYTDFIREHHAVVKEITVLPGKKLSLQSHNFRKECWIVMSGSGKALLEDKEIKLFSGIVVLVDVGQKHRIINNSDAILRIAEVQLGKCLETDIIRYEDDFGREGTSN